MEPELVHVNVKLLRGTDREAARKRLSITPGVEDVIETFPGETDEELASLYSLKVCSGRVGEVIAQLQRDAAVDFVETAAPRKLINPIQKPGSR